MAIAVIGSGIAGLAAAYRLQTEAAVTLFEAGAQFGGQAFNLDVTLPDSQGVPTTHAADMGCLGFNPGIHPGLGARPPGWTVAGGARQFVQDIVASLSDARLNTPVLRVERGAEGVWVHTQEGAQYYDAVVLAVRSDQALELLAHPSAREREVLGSIPYRSSRAVLHMDVSVLPARPEEWAAWNYEGDPEEACKGGQLRLHFWLNVLQPLPFAQPVFVSVNASRPIAPQHVLAEFDYVHPVFDATAMEARQRLSQLQGWCNTWYCGAWARQGFLEDSSQSGYAAAEGVLASLRRLKSWNKSADIGRASEPDDGFWSGGLPQAAT